MEWKILQGCFKSKNEKKTHEETEFLLPFTGCRKVLGKMPEFPDNCCHKKIEKSVQRDFTLILMKFHNFFV